MLTFHHHPQSAPPTLPILCRQYTESVAVVALSRKLYQVVATANNLSQPLAALARFVYGKLTGQSPPWRFVAESSVEYAVSPLSYCHRVSV